jgi:hypothetical protein
MTDPMIKSSDRIDFVLRRYDGPNRLIVAGDFCLEGFKLHDTSGYELSIVHNDEQRIAQAITSFERVFSEAKAEGSTKLSVIRELERHRLASFSKSAGRISKSESVVGPGKKIPTSKAKRRQTPE